MIKVVNYKVVILPMPGVNKYPTVRLHSRIYENLSEPYGHSASSALERYFWLLASEKPEFTEAEWNLLFDACHGWWSQSELAEQLVQSLVAELEDAIDSDNLDTKWGVNSDSFLEKLNGLTSVQRLSTILVIERFWKSQIGNGWGGEQS